MKKTRGRPARFDQDQILDAATALFAEQGFDGTSMGEILKAIGCTPPSLYNYFKSKEELYLAVLERYWSGKMPELSSDGRARSTFESYLAATLDRFYPDQGTRGCLVLTGDIRGATEHSKFRDLLKSRRKQQFDVLVDMTKAMQDQGDLDADIDPIHWSRSLFSLVQGLAIQAMDGASRADLQAAIDIFLSRYITARAD